VLITLLQSTKTTDHPLRLTSHRTNWLKYKKYVSSHFKLTPHFHIEADIDCSTDTLEKVFVEEATISTPQGRDVQTNIYFPTTIVSAKGDRESHWGTETEKGPWR